jgi:hypothetical protein
LMYCIYLRFQLYSLPCVAFAVAINIPKFFEVNLVFR